MDKCLLHTGDRSFLYRNWGWPLLITLICLISWERGRGRGERSIFADIYERRNYHVQIKHFSNDFLKSPSCPLFHPHRHTSWRWNIDSSLGDQMCLKVTWVISGKFCLNSPCLKKQRIGTCGYEYLYQLCWVNFFSGITKILQLFNTLLITWSGEVNGNPLQYSCPEDSMDWGVWWAAVLGVAKSRTRLSD